MGLGEVSRIGGIAGRVADSDPLFPAGRQVDAVHPGDQGTQQLEPGALPEYLAAERQIQKDHSIRLAAAPGQFLPALEELSPGWLSLLLAMVNLYTYFQLLTDLAALAEETLEDGNMGKKLRTCRTLLVVIQTALYLQDLFLRFPALAVPLIAVSFCVFFVLLFQLWGFSRDLEQL